MKLTLNGVSTIRKPGTFAAEGFTNARGGDRVQWDYRDMNGDLHSGVALDLEGAERAAGLYGFHREQGEVRT